MLWCPCKQFKTNEFQNGMSLKPSSYYKYRDDTPVKQVKTDTKHYCTHCYII